MNILPALLEDKPFHIFGVRFLFVQLCLPLFQLAFQVGLFCFVIRGQFLKANIILALFWARGYGILRCNYVLLDQIFVSLEYRSRGIGKQLRTICVGP